MFHFFRSNLQAQTQPGKAQPSKHPRHFSVPVFYNRLVWGIAWSLIGFLGYAALFEFAWADCQNSYKQAIDLLNTTTKKASQNEHPNADAFSSEFKTIVGSLQSQKCLPELMSLIQHIQSEQQKIPSSTFPAEAKDNRTPITD